MREFNFKGTQYGPGLAAALAASVQGQIAASSFRVRGAESLGAGLANFGGGIGAGFAQRGQQRGQREESALDRAFSQGQAELDRELSLKRDELERSFRETQALEQRRAQFELQKLGMMESLAGAAAGQGYPAPEMLEMLRGEYEQSGALGAGAGQPPGSQVPVSPQPGGPGGYLLDPQQAGDPMYQALQLEGRAGGRRFTDLKPLPQQPDWQERKFALEQERNAHKQKVKADLNAFIMSPKGRKSFYVPVKMKRLELYDLEGLPPNELEKRVQSLWPYTRIQEVGVGEDKTSDRTNLDAHLRWLSEPIVEEVGSGAIAGELYQRSRQKYEQEGVPPDVVDEVMNEFWDESGGFAKSMREAKQIAKANALKKMQAADLEPRPVSVSVQAGSLEQALGAAHTQETIGRAGSGPMQSMPWTKESLQSMDLEYGMLSKPLQAAADFGFTVAPSPDGRLVFQPVGGTQPSAEMQLELDKLMESSGVEGRVEARSAAGAVTPSPTELDKAQQMRKGTKKAPANQTPSGTPASTPPNAPTQRPSALERYEALKREGAPKPSAKPTSSIKVPRVFRLAGDDAVSRLLAGAGGR